MSIRYPIKQLAVLLFLLLANIPNSLFASDKSTVSRYLEPATPLSGVWISEDGRWVLLITPREDDPFYKGQAWDNGTLWVEGVFSTDLLSFWASGLRTVRASGTGAGDWYLDPFTDTLYYYDRTTEILVVLYRAVDLR